MLKRSAAGAPPGAACGNLQVHLDQRKGEVGSDQAGGHKLADRRDQLGYTTYLLAMHVVIAGERSDGSVGANAAVLEAQSAKTTLFFISGSRKTARDAAEAKERIWPLYVVIL